MSENNSISTKLIAIQNELKVPKTRTNNFAKKPFNYRNAEDILSAAKVVCQKHGCLLTLTDEIVLIGDRYYVKAIAKIDDGTATISTSAFARECASKSGFDEAQLTGSASSYARKYALNGLFGLDDAEDPDSQDNSKLQNPDGILVCSECGATLSIKEHDWSVKVKGRPLCRICQGMFPNKK